MPNSTNSKPAAAPAVTPGGDANGGAAETDKTSAAAEVIEQSAKPADPAPDPTQGKSSSVPLNSSSLEDALRRTFER